MVEFLAIIIGALTAGALAKAGDVGGRAVADAYDAFRALIVRKLGKGGAVQSVEDEPRSEPAQAALAEALTKAGLAADPELAQHAKALDAAIEGAAGTGGAAIEVGDIFGNVNVLVNNLVATGRIKLGDIQADTGDVTLTNLMVGGVSIDGNIAVGGDIVGGNKANAENKDIVTAEYSVWYATNRTPVKSNGDVIGFSSSRSEDLYYGKCRIFVPKSHKIGSVGSPFWRRLLTWTDDRLSLIGIDPFSASEFWNAIKHQIKPFSPEERHATIFIHGYNVSFENAALRAAQIGFDLSIKTAMAFFSWPSRGTLRGYSADEATIEWSAGAIEEFLVNFVENSGASAVHVIAHSMGNRGMLSAINAIAKRAEKRTRTTFSQVILAAADVDTGLLRKRYRDYVDLSKRTTLYVSTRDAAVGASSWLHKFPRAGLVPPLFIAPGIDTIRVTNVDLTALGHGYVAEARSVLADMYRLVHDGAPPEKRMGLIARKNEYGELYWEFSA